MNDRTCPHCLKPCVFALADDGFPDATFWREWQCTECEWVSDKQPLTPEDKLSLMVVKSN